MLLVATLIFKNDVSMSYHNYNIIYNYSKNKQFLYNDYSNINKLSANKNSRLKKSI